jgi:hypothetical protein
MAITTRLAQLDWKHGEIDRSMVRPCIWINLLLVKRQFLGKSERNFLDT